MIDWVTQHLEGIIAFGELAGFIVMGLFAFTGIFSTKQSERRGESDRVADTLIERLQKTVDKNADDMTAMSARIDDQQKEIHQLQGKNEAYLQIITLRDPNVAKVFEEAPVIHGIIRENNVLAKGQLEALKQLTETIEKFINSLPPLMPSVTK